MNYKVLRSPNVHLALGLPALALSLFANPAPAVATRPTVRTAIAIRTLKLSMPIELTTAVDKKLTGLAEETETERAQAIASAKDYVAYRMGGPQNARAKWLAKCEAEKPETRGYFCSYELMRSNKSASLRHSSGRESRREIATLMKAGRFDELASHAYPDIVGAVSHLGEPEALYPIAERVLAKKCVPSSVSAAIGYKLEEIFPDEKAVETASRLYRMASDCGKDFSSAKASFRLGLIEIWKNNCSEIESLMSKVEAVPDASQFHSRAKYWRYHCASTAGNLETQKSAKEALLKDYPLSFHNLAANGDDDKAISEIIARPNPSIALRTLVRPDLNQVLRAGEALLEAGAPQLMAEMFDRNVAEFGGMEPETRLYTAVLLNRAGYALPKFKILGDLFQDSPRMISAATMKLLFPLWYFDLVKPRGEKIDPLLILALIRQESAFNKEARSIVGARGLMQVMPATARSIASVRAKALFDPQTNIQVGTKYFSNRLQQFRGDVELTLAAYNAGSARVDQWVKRYPTGNKILFLDFIPFKETREYVATILRNYYWYVKLYGNDTAVTPVEGPKVHSSGPKTLSIISANAGLAANLGGE